MDHNRYQVNKIDRAQSINPIFEVYMENQNNKTNFASEYDAVVIGAGLGGLSAAAKLALDNAKVLLLEQHNIPGGFATSFVRGRFEFETSLHELSDVGPEDNPGGVRSFFLDELGLDLQFLRVPEAYRIIATEEDIDVDVPYGVENFIQTIEKADPNNQSELERYFEYCTNVRDALHYLGSIKGKPDFSKLIKEYKPFVNTIDATVDDVLKDFQFSPKAKAILHAYWCYLGIPLDKLSFTIWAAMLHSYITKGAYIPTNTSHGLSLSLDKKIRECGGQIEYNTRVEQILVDDKGVAGVVTHKGETIKTRNVISNASQHLVYGKLIHPKSRIPKEALKLTQARQIGVSGFVVYMGLDAPPEELNLHNYGYFISKVSDEKKAYREAGLLKPQDFQAVICLNKANPDCSPPGTTIVSTTTIYKPDVWSKVHPKDYHRLKSEFAHAMIDQIANALDSPLKEHIEEIEVATPITFSRYTGGFRGSIYGYEHFDWDSILTRALFARKEHYIKGLEFAGGHAQQGHGYSSSIHTGRMAAVSVLKRLSS